MQCNTAVVESPCRTALPFSDTDHLEILYSQTYVPAPVHYCEAMAEVRVRVSDAGVSGSWKAELRFFWLISSLLMAGAEEVLW